MNYRHEFHAGNFADVVKHVALSRIVAHLALKPAPFRVIDTHAGAGLYDLSGPEATRTGEWRDGIARLFEATFDPEVRTLLAPYLDAVLACNQPRRLTRYPGSPLLLRIWLRPKDRLLACELESRAAAALVENLDGTRRAKVLKMDGWSALAAHLPPKERRGMVLIDPPFEAPDDFARLAAGVAQARRKWATGIYLLWYPVKDRKGPDRLATQLRRSGGKILRAEFSTARRMDPDRLTSCGLIVVNPPWTLEKELTVLLPALAECLGCGQGKFRVDWLAREN